MGEGKLIIKTYLADDALPVEGALVQIEAVDEGVADHGNSRFTDANGITPPVILPAPSAEYSASPLPPEQPYALYTVKVMKDGYYTKVIERISAFDGVTTFLPVNMILKSADGTAPADTLNSTSYENPKL